MARRLSNPTAPAHSATLHGASATTRLSLQLGPAGVLAYGGVVESPNVRRRAERVSNAI